MTSPPPSPSGEFIYQPPPAGPLPVLFADKHILVLDKPSGLLSVPGNAPERADCLETRAREQFPFVRVIHRLDMDTSGVMVMALTAEAQSAIGLQFEKRLTIKRYAAIVWGNVRDESGRIDAPMITDWPNRPKQHIDEVNGKQAITDWRVLDRQNGFTRVELSPVTGRSHQLRVHMAHIGHPILGDKFYAHEAALKASDRLCLHARQLAFTHPETGQVVNFTSPVPF